MFFSFARIQPNMIIWKVTKINFPTAKILLNRFHKTKFKLKHSMLGPFRNCSEKIRQTSRTYFLTFDFMILYSYKLPNYYEWRLRLLIVFCKVRSNLKASYFNRNKQKLLSRVPDLNPNCVQQYCLPSTNDFLNNSVYRLLLYLRKFAKLILIWKVLLNKAVEVIRLVEGIIVVVVVIVDVNFVTVLKVEIAKFRGQTWGGRMAC